MQFQRLHIRVPASGEANLLLDNEVKVAASIVNVSSGGLCISSPSDLIVRQEYQIQLISPAHGCIEFSGRPVYQNDERMGIKITSIDKDHSKTISQIVESFQITEDFIKYIDESTIINEWLADESGDNVSITFETEH